MPSRAELARVRTFGEIAARVLAVLALLLILVEVIRPVPSVTVRNAADAEIGPALRAVTLTGSQAILELWFSRIPEPVYRDWAAALRRAGATVDWRGDRIPAAGTSLEPVADPRGGFELRLWRGEEEPAVVRDAAGELIRLDAAKGVSAVAVPSLVQDARVMLPRQIASSTAADSLRLGAVLVLGRAGWEARFLLRTLEDLGWSARARLSVAPDAYVEQGRVLPIDTAHYAAVVVLDSTAAPLAPAIGRYLRSGGGVILSGDGAAIRAFDAYQAGRSAALIPASRETLPADTPFAGLPLRPLVQLRDDALVLETRGRDAVVAARRIGAGRVLQVGYQDSWRVRMEGGDGDPHREWWAKLIAGVAHAPVVTRHRPQSAAEPLPVAALVDALGPPASASVAPLMPLRLPLLPFFIAAITLLLLEWISRRLRGAA